MKFRGRMVMTPSDKTQNEKGNIVYLSNYIDRRCDGQLFHPNLMELKQCRLRWHHNGPHRWWSNYSGEHIEGIDR